MSVSSGATSVDNAFRDTLVVESVNLLQGDLVLEKSGPGALGCVAFSLRLEIGLGPEEHERG